MTMKEYSKQSIHSTAWYIASKYSVLILTITRGRKYEEKFYGTMIFELLEKQSMSIP